ncbi:MAG: hypothetical protein H5U02_04995 [Clostridia bacterium]|nr:hypothetical protein [Clostridia bacterium]
MFLLCVEGKLSALVELFDITLFRRAAISKFTRNICDADRNRCFHYTDGAEYVTDYKVVSKMELEIHFYSKDTHGASEQWIREILSRSDLFKELRYLPKYEDQASVLVRGSFWNQEGLFGEKGFGEILLLACFVCRQLVNFGVRDDIGNALAVLLLDAGQEIANIAEGVGVARKANIFAPALRAEKCDVLFDMLCDRVVAAGFGAVELCEYPGHPGRVRFLASLDNKRNCLRFTCKPKGIGFLRSGDIAYYAPTAAIAFLRYLTEKQKTNRGYLLKLAAAVTTSSLLFLKGRLRVQNQLETSMMVASSTYCAGEEENLLNARGALQELLGHV